MTEELLGAVEKRRNIPVLEVVHSRRNVSLFDIPRTGEALLSLAHTCFDTPSPPFLILKFPNPLPSSAINPLKLPHAGPLLPLCV